MNLYKRLLRQLLVLLVIAPPALYGQGAIPGVNTGPGNALSFNGINNYVDLPLMSSIDNSSNLTVECWVNCNTITGVPFAHWINSEYPIGVPVGFYISLNGTEISVAVNANWTSVTTDANLQTGQWYHIACVFNGTLTGDENRLKVYVNGIQKVMDFVTSQPVPIPPTLGNVSNITHIGARRNTVNELIEFMDGKEDEVRVWNISLTQTDIRNGMCKKLIGNEPGLIGYWRLDEGTGISCADSQTNLPVNNGTLQNGTGWVLSGAPLGDKSSWQYALSSVSLAVSGETFTANNFTGSSKGAHIYYTHSVPSITNGIIGLGTNDRYFGVFVAGGTSPVYDIAYNFTGNNNITSPSPCSMYKRVSNDKSPWLTAGASLSNPVYHKTGELSRGEYIVANNLLIASQTITACNSYSWHGTTYISSGNYQYSVNNPSGCDSILRLQLFITGTTSSTQIITTCNSFVWSGNTYTTSGIYRDTILNTAGCDSIKILKLTIDADVSSEITRSICQGEAYAGHTASGTYIDSFTTVNGCDSLRTLHLVLSTKPLPELGDDKELCAGNSLVLSPGNFDSYLWQDNSTLDHFVARQGGLYTVTVKNSCGTEADKIYISENLCHEYFPSAFTPNADGTNELFKILNAFDLRDYTLSVFNRWGQKLFETQDYRQGWDGRFNGYGQNAGSYVYYCKYTKTGGVIETKGTINLIR